jgi:chemotaxis protein CheX
MLIAPPKVLTRGQPAPRADEMAPFAIPMNWERYEAHLVVRMQPGA